jgi:hypothetical protein
VDEHICSEFTAKHVCTPSRSSDFALSEADSQFCGIRSYQRSPCCVVHALILLYSMYPKYIRDSCPKSDVYELDMLYIYPLQVG